MSRISLLLVCLACTSNGRRLQSSQSKDASVLNPLNVLRKFLLVFHSTSAFHPSSAKVGHSSESHLRAVAMDRQRRIAPLSPTMSEAVAAGPTTNQLVTALSKDGFLSAKALDTTALINEVSEMQGLSGLAAAALGRAMMCCLLLAEGMEKKEVFQVRFEGDGPIEGVTASCSGNLMSRGYVGNPQVYLPPNALGKFDVGGAVGQGLLQVTRSKNLPGDTQTSNYNSVVDIQSGEIPEDINYFLADSEQRTSALAAGVLVKGSNPNSNSACVIAAGGWYVDVLPGAPEEVIEALEKNLQAIYSRAPTQMLREGLGPEDMVNLILDGMEPQIMNRHRPPSLEESCTCSLQQLLHAVTMLPEDEIEDIYEKGEDLDCKCDFCGKKYAITPSAIREYIAKEEKEAKEAAEAEAAAKKAERAFISGSEVIAAAKALAQEEQGKAEAEAEAALNPLAGNWAKERAKALAEARKAKAE